MTEFFDQICEVLARTGKKNPGQLGKTEEMRQFFSALPAPAELPAAPEPVRGVPAVPVIPETPEVTPEKSVPQSNITAGDLEALFHSMGNCQKCRLCAGRKNIVFGEGDPNARLMFIGEGPGADEDQSGRPFVGKAGELLNKMIGAMQFSRQEVYIANIVKCRPAGNRNPAPDEIAECIPFLHRQIELIRPEVIVCLGAVAAKALLQTESGISRLRGKWCSFANIPVMPTFHPAFLLRQESAKKEAWQDLQLVMARFGKHYPGRR